MPTMAILFLETLICKCNPAIYYKRFVAQGYETLMFV